MVPSPALGEGLTMKNQITRILAVCAGGVLTMTAFTSRPAANGEPTKLLRMPTVSATQIAFAYANNIWTVERSGGMARRLTSFQGQASNPHFSPDGKSIAFSAEYAGNVDVFVGPRELGAERGAAVLDRAGRRGRRRADGAAARLPGQDVGRRRAHRVSH